MSVLLVSMGLKTASQILVVPLGRALVEGFLSRWSR
jgi:hypothetical protein